MCSLIILLRPGHAWPLLLAANRDELASRPWKAPGRHWPDRPEVVAGIDLLSGGSWMGLNDHGLVACVLNRVGSLGPAPGKRSRGELVLEALDHAEAGAAAEALSQLDPAAYRSFNLVVADGETAFWLRSEGEAEGAVEAFPLPEGLSMITAHDLNDRDSPRIGRFLPAFAEAAVPDPEAGDWTAWSALQATSDAAQPFAGLCVVTDGDFGTVSASQLALPRPPQSLDEAPRQPIWRFTDGPPNRYTFHTISLL